MPSSRATLRRKSSILTMVLMNPKARAKVLCSLDPRANDITASTSTGPSDNPSGSKTRGRKF